MPGVTGPVFVPFTRAPTHLGDFRNPVVPLTPVVRLSNNAEGGYGLVGTTVTAGVGGNSGGRSGNFVDIAQVGANASLTFDNAITCHGSFAYKFQTGASSVQSQLSWLDSIVALAPGGVPRLYWRAYLSTPASFVVAPMITRLQSLTADAGRFTWNSSGNIQIRNTATTVVGTTTTAMAVSTKYRVEAYLSVDGSGEVRLFGPGKLEAPIDQFDESLVVTAQNFGTDNIIEWQIGQAAALANMGPWVADDFAISNQDWLGPVGPDYVPQLYRSLHSPRPKLCRRPTIWIPADQAVPPATTTRNARRMVRAARPRQVTPVPAQTAPPQSTTHARLRAWRPFRARIARPATEQTGVAAFQRARFRWLRRPETTVVNPVPTQAAPAAPTYPPAPVHARLRLLRLTRGRVAFPAPPQASVAAPIYPPQPLHARLRAAARLLRSRSSVPVPSQVAPPSQLPRQRLRWLRPKRGRVALPAPMQAAPPSRLPQPIQQLLRILRPRRARVAQPVPAQIVGPPPTFVPSPIQAAVRFALARRGHASSFWPQDEDCGTPPPFTGTTPYAFAGTAPAFTGSTADSVGTTAPSSTGTTDDPC